MADMMGRPFTQEERQLSQLRNEKVSPQILFATLTFDHHLKPVHFFVRLENVLPSQKDDCHSLFDTYYKRSTHHSYN